MRVCNCTSEISNKREINSVATYKKMKYNLQYFADGAGGEKTEDATSKKLTDARTDGQVAKSQEFVMATSLMALFVILKIYVTTIGTKLIESFSEIYNKIPVIVSEDFNEVVAHGLIKQVFIDIIIIALPVFIVSFCVAFLVNLLQIKWQITMKPLMPKFSKMNPIKGFKKIISKDKIFELIKSIVKIVVIFYVVYDTLKDEWDIILQLYDISLNGSIALVGNMVISLGIKISALYMIIGLGDLFFQKMKFKNDMKMTKQEIKDEYKQSEGDPHVKGQIKAKMREISRRRMMQDLPKADVVITNPTHFAVAIRYEKDTAKAPIVIAKGADYLAAKIKEVARDNKIEIVENKPLARMLYFNVEIGAEVPQELYQTVAEVLAYVYGLKNKLG